MSFSCKTQLETFLRVHESEVKVEQITADEYKRSGRSRIIYYLTTNKAMK